LFLSFPPINGVASLYFFSPFFELRLYRRTYAPLFNFSLMLLAIVASQECILIALTFLLFGSRFASRTRPSRAVQDLGRFESISRSLCWPWPRTQVLPTSFLELPTDPLDPPLSGTCFCPIGVYGTICSTPFNPSPPFSLPSPQFVIDRTCIRFAPLEDIFVWCNPNLPL